MSPAFFSHTRARVTFLSRRSAITGFARPVAAAAAAAATAAAAAVALSAAQRK